MLNLFQVYTNLDAINGLTSVLRSGYVGQGEKSDEFENLLKNHFQNDNLATVNSGTSALHLAVRLIIDKYNLSSDTEVLCTCLSCFATAVPILANNLKIKWCDVDLKTCNIDLGDVRRKLTSKTRILMVVHWGGNPCDLEEIEKIKAEYKEIFGQDLIVIEDCAHCWDSFYKEKMIGNSGNFCCFSTQAIKFLTTVDGGFIISPNSEYHKKAKLIRWFGLDRDSGVSFRCVQDISSYGYKFQPNDVLSTIGIYNYPTVSLHAGKHKENAAFYNKELKNVDGVTLLENAPEAESSYWLYTIRVKNRDSFIKKLKSEGIEASQVHKRMDQHSCVEEFKCFLPNMDVLQNDMVCIPVGFWISADDRQKIVDVIKNGW
jgi:dTDP-4-amino-4,6-dideoxygalactose transaminase